MNIVIKSKTRPRVLKRKQQMHHLNFDSIDIVFVSYCSKLSVMFLNCIFIQISLISFNKVAGIKRNIQWDIVRQICQEFWQPINFLEGLGRPKAGRGQGGLAPQTE